MPRRRKTTFALEEHVRLMTDLQRDPLSVLTHFKGAGVESLSEMAGWKDICRYHPDIADCIRHVAAMLDIPEKRCKERSCKRRCES